MNVAFFKTYNCSTRIAASNNKMKFTPIAEEAKIQYAQNIKIKFHKGYPELYNNMEREIKELDMEALRQEILRKCKKEPAFLALREKEDYEHREEAVQEEDVSSMRIAEEELPFEEILAEKRREYTTKEDFIYSLYNSILPAFIAEWDGYFLRKKLFVRKFSKDDMDTIDEVEGFDYCEESEDLFVEEKEKEKEEYIPPWKLLLPDEFVDIKFYNGNTYSGRVSRKMMEGEGTYTWNSGIQYKGEFEQNQIRGRGLLKWDEDCWYEGDFVDGLRHGTGTMVDEKLKRMYSGQWCMSRIVKSKGSEEQL